MFAMYTPWETLENVWFTLPHSPLQSTDCKSQMSPTCYIIIVIKYGYNINLHTYVNNKVIAILSPINCRHRITDLLL